MKWTSYVIIAGLVLVLIGVFIITTPETTPATQESTEPTSQPPAFQEQPEASTQEVTSPDTQEVNTMTKKVKLETNHGDIVIELASDMPITAGNFEKLISQGFYDGVIFHRVIKGFMLQGGDPEGTGMGGPGYHIKDEFTDHNKNDRGTLSMANAGPNTGGSQFFINLVNNNFLDPKHPVFGKVIEGMDVVDKIGNVRTDSGDRPVDEVRIVKASMV